MPSWLIGTAGIAAIGVATYFAMTAILRFGLVIS